MKKAILIAILTFPFLTFAGIGFISNGTGHSCYQDVSDAIVQAQKNADENAENMCGEVRAWRVSKYHRTDNGSYCAVKVQAKYICQ